MRSQNWSAMSRTERYARGARALRVVMGELMRLTFAPESRHAGGVVASDAEVEGTVHSYLAPAQLQKRPANS